MEILNYIDPGMFMSIGLGIVLLAFIIFAFFLHALRRESRVATDYFEKLNSEVVPEEKVDLIGENDSNEEQSKESKNILKVITDEHYKMYYELLERHKMQTLMDKFDDEKNKELSDGYIHMNEIAKILNIDLEKVLEFFLKEGYLEREEYNLKLTEKGEEEGGRNIDFEAHTLIAWPKEIVEQLHRIKRTTNKYTYKSRDEWIGWFWIIVVAVVFFSLFGR